MDYAEKILRKYGWKEGEGLGKDGRGISKPVKCGLKFDKSGIGYEEKRSKEENDQWWIRMFNQAASNISSSDSSASNNKRKKKSKSVEDVPPNRALTDEELFAACGGRTAHKAARHGFRLNGKLNRISQQETRNTTTSTSTERTALELVEGNKRKKSRPREDRERIPVDELDPTNNETIEKKKKSKKIDSQIDYSIDEPDVVNNTDQVDEISLHYNTNCSKSKKNKKRKRTNE